MDKTNNHASRGAPTWPQLVEEGKIRCTHTHTQHTVQGFGEWHHVLATIILKSS